MDAARLQSKVYSGYGKAALRIGYDFTVYRPNGANAPIVSGNIFGSPINAAFTPRASGFNFEITSTYEQPLFHGLFDATNLLVGDYLVNASHGTYFIIAKQDQAPVLCVQCNNTVSIVRPEGPSGVGAQGYSGATTSSETPVMTSWPASLVFDARGRNSGAALPMDEVNPYFTVLLPALSGVDVRPSDIVTDGNSPARRYIVASSEHSPLGWRMMVRQAVA
jgi:hypothetical protein